MIDIIIQSHYISGECRFLEGDCLLRDAHEGECNVSKITCCVDVEGPPKECPLREGAIKISIATGE